MHITIVRRPIGEAPPWVRDAWIGLSLPISAPSERRVHGFGVMTVPGTVLKQLWAILRGKSVRITGFTVNARSAVDLLAQVRPDAAKWWWDNAPQLLDGRHGFIFDSPCCERLDNQ